ncbi:hypothetical protein LNQ49_21920 [Flavobacterium sp. F-65]|uniref:Intein N-terminal splicing region n=1 Tax=Flavobacterium pisciphilum TaxID=2893755 RepID=A0ABS8MZQ4_9FLAO|nr:hypothetical protein [Flavobacterium sp. F-65]MCC9074253.1 hypothetical protein [Flavobacterium sp. F-65]
MKKNILWFLVLILIFSCNGNKENNLNSEKTHIKTESEKIKNDLKSSDKIVFGEDKKEINAFLKRIYKINDEVVIDIDFVQIKYENVDEKIIINKNSKIRTYKVDSNTLIYSKDCKTLNKDELFKNRDKIEHDKSTVLVGEAEDGKMKSLNFGCYD